MRLFRAVHTDPPTERDFESAWEQGRRPAKLSQASYRAYAGVSVYASLDQLRAKAKAFPAIGAYAAELEVPDEVPREGPAPDGHVRLVNQTPGLIMRHLVAVYPLETGNVHPMRE